MKRREFVGLFGGAAAWPLAAGAQQQAMPVVGFLSGAAPQEYGHILAAFRRGLGEAGFVDGRDVAIEFHWAEGQFDKLPAMAADLVRRRVAVIVAGGTHLPALAAKSATSTIPIVFSAGSDPIDSGLVKSINRPEANVTGVSMFSNELSAKRLALLRSLVPTSRVIGFISNPQIKDTQISSVQTAARSLGVQIELVSAASEPELDVAFATLAGRAVDAVMVGADAFYNSHRAYIVDLAARHALPASYSLRDYVVDGGLTSYGTSITDAYRQAGGYVGRLLKGAMPSELPVLLPTKFELVINLKTARALGLTVPNSMQLLADELVE